LGSRIQKILALLNQAALIIYITPQKIFLFIIFFKGERKILTPFLSGIYRLFMEYACQIKAHFYNEMSPLFG